MRIFKESWQITHKLEPDWYSNSCLCKCWHTLDGIGKDNNDKFNIGSNMEFDLP